MSVSNSPDPRLQRLDVQYQRARGGDLGAALTLSVMAVVAFTVVALVFSPTKRIGAGLKIVHLYGTAPLVGLICLLGVACEGLNVWAYRQNKNQLLSPSVPGRGR